MTTLECPKCGNKSPYLDENGRRTRKCHHCGATLPPTLEEVHDRVWLPVCIACAVVTALALATFFTLYGTAEDTGEWRVEGGGDSAQFIPGLILGSALGWGVGWVVARFLIAPAWWRLRHAPKNKLGESSLPSAYARQRPSRPRQ